MRRLLSKVIVTSARPRLRREVEPLKMTSAISPPRRLFALCSPRIQRTASTILLLPLPLGPTPPVIPAAKSNCVLSAKLLNPTNSKRLSMPSLRNQESGIRNQESVVSCQSITSDRSPVISHQLAPGLWLGVGCHHRHRER